MTYSFIDFGTRDFLRSFEQGPVLELEADSYEEAEEWLLNNGEDFGWTNTGVRYWCWEEEL
jgi:hypothetical protein